MPEDNLDLAVLKLVEEVVDLARILGERITLREPPYGALRHIAWIPEPRDERLRSICRSLCRVLLFVGSGARR